jgi:hypothetical protein
MATASSTPALGPLPGQTIIDDANHQYVKYVGNWTNQTLTAESPDWNAKFYAGTYHASNYDGEYFEIKWKGTGIQVIATTREK